MPGRVYPDRERTRTKLQPEIHPWRARGCEGEEAKVEAAEKIEFAFQ